MTEAMIEAVAKLFEPLLRLLLPASGRHRSAAPGHASAYDDASAVALRRMPVQPLRGEDVGLVRPYLVAHERREEAKRQRARRRVLWLAVHGIDAGPRWIHGVEVAA